MKVRRVICDTRAPLPLPMNLFPKNPKSRGLLRRYNGGRVHVNNLQHFYTDSRTYQPTHSTSIPGINPDRALQVTDFQAD
jgi:hypothetical protein